MDKDYVNRKIENCEKLVKTATSEDQKKIYQGYLDYWTEKLPKKGYTYNISVRNANMFEIEHAPKQAYYSRGGETHKTKAFKEFLNQRTQ